MRIFGQKILEVPKKKINSKASSRKFLLVVEILKSRTE